jgi:hypothetical protein
MTTYLALGPETLGMRREKRVMDPDDWSLAWRTIKANNLPHTK